MCGIQTANVIRSRRAIVDGEALKGGGAQGVSST